MFLHGLIELLTMQWSTEKDGDTCTYLYFNDQQKKTKHQTITNKNTPQKTLEKHEIQYSLVLNSGNGITCTYPYFFGVERNCLVVKRHKHPDLNANNNEVKLLDYSYCWLLLIFTTHNVLPHKYKINLHEQMSLCVLDVDFN